MAVLVTGASGFIGKHLVERLLARGETVHALVREGSKQRFLEAAAERWPGRADRIVPVVGDITQPFCGIPAEDRAALAGTITGLFHLAAVYDMGVDLESAYRNNVDGTRHVVSLANALGCRLHHVSSIAVAGKHKGVFREDMFDVGQKLEHPYFATKYESEAVVRRDAKVPYRIYRPGVVIGSSKTGEADKIDGPYYAFKSIQRIRNALPQWFPLIGLEGGRLPLVPVDYVAAGIDCIAHTEGLDGKAFHLLDPRPPSVGEALNEFCKAAHAPRMGARVDRRITSLIPTAPFEMLGQLPATRAFRKDIFQQLGIPESVLELYDWRTHFDTRDAEAVLKPAGIVCPPLSSYAWRVWDYWERHMDPDLFRERSLSAALAGKRVMITGASSGIGRSIALKVAEAGGTPILVARSRDKLEALRDEIVEKGGNATVHSCDLSEVDACERLVHEILAEGDVDVLINNAGRSIRRSIKHSEDRFHDFERTMKLNYFGSLKLILGFLPSWRKRRSGHVINISSIGVQTNTPRFSAYVASKAALDSFSRVAASELLSYGIHITTVYMPLVRTPMIAPTKMYDAFPALTPDEAADLVLSAIVTLDKQVTTQLGTFATIAYAVAPKFVDYVLNMGYRMFPDSAAAHPGDKQAPAPTVSAEGMALAYLLQGVHW